MTVPIPAHVLMDGREHCPPGGHLLVDELAELLPARLVPVRDAVRETSKRLHLVPGVYILIDMEKSLKSKCLTP